MSRKAFKSQASSGRAGDAVAFGAFGSSSAFGSTRSSQLSYIQEPPDYSAISDANIVVALKNLTKRDSTTKSKALEEIQSSISGQNADVEEGFLQAWIQLYPRLSIDSARRVRQQSHTLNGLICSKCGKRIVAYLPKIAGSWLAGIYDNDRAAGKAAQDALTLVFPSPEKILGLKKAFQASILEYYRAAIFDETVQTLSDERTVTPDDAKATYSRVIATSLAVVADLVAELSESERSKHHHLYEEILSNTALWEFACHADPAIRKTFHRLVRMLLADEPKILEGQLKHISTAYVYKGLVSDQSGSSAEYMTTLDALTAVFPSIWTDSYAGKRPAISRLKQNLKQGSRTGILDYWRALEQLLSKLPASVLPGPVDEAISCMEAARGGVTKREERQVSAEAWSTYFTLLGLLCQNIPAQDREKLMETCALPLIDAYLQPSSQSAEWTISGPKAVQVVAHMFQLEPILPVVEQSVPAMADRLINAAKMSQPQQSKDYNTSQTEVGAMGDRWAALQKVLSSQILQPSLQKVLTVANVRSIEECVKLLQTREGKPYGAASVIEAILNSTEGWLLNDVSVVNSLKDLLSRDDFSWTTWPSNRQLLGCLYAIGEMDIFDDLFRGALRRMLQQVDSSGALSSGLQLLLTRELPPRATALARSDAILQDMAVKLFSRTSSEVERRAFFQLYRLGILDEGTVDSCIKELLQQLDLKEDPELARMDVALLSGLDDKVLQSLTLNRSGHGLLPRLVHLEQSEDDDLAHQVAALALRLSSLTTDETESSQKLNVVRDQLDRASANSLSLDGLVNLTSKLVGGTGKVQNLRDVLPDLSVWTTALVDVMEPPRASMALLSPLGGCVHLIDSSQATHIASPGIDAEGLSQALRIATFTVKCVDNSLDETISVLLYLTTLLAEDAMSIVGSNVLYSPSSATEALVMEFVTEANARLESVWATMKPGTQSTRTFVAELDALQSLYGKTPAASYYFRLAFAKINANLLETHGYGTDFIKESEALLKDRSKMADTLTTAASVVAFQQPLAGTSTLHRLINELVTNVTDADALDRNNLEQIVLLNVILANVEDAVGKISKQRLIFLVKKLISELDKAQTRVEASELCKALTYLLPGMQDMYGEHWAQLLSYISELWFADDEQSVRSEEHTLLLNTTLRLCGMLIKLSKSDDPNDDLVEAIKDSGKALFAGLLTQLEAANGLSSEGNQPLLITHELLARLLAGISHGKKVEDYDELYMLLHTPSRPLVDAAFELLHAYIPIAQEQVTIDATVDNKTVALPFELLSLLVEAPTLDSMVEASFDSGMPLQLVGYLYSWRLVFDHFKGSGSRVKADYTEQLRESSYVDGLLNLAFDWLGHTRGKPIDVSRFDVRDFVPHTESNHEREVQWLLSHLYFLCLKHLPGLVKAYFLDIRSRQTSSAVESWTAKYISPLVIEDTLKEVAEWAEKTSKDDPESEKLTVKVGMRSKEINVSYVVDEQTMAIKVVLPEAYPLASAQVIGVNRVAVKEEKWQSWLRNCQGVITFSNGSIQEGLYSWRKNVLGALQNQTECSICYSLVSADKQLPTKRCPTCRNSFHSSCLARWFKTSNGSTCPLCRTQFNFNERGGRSMNHMRNGEA